MHVEKLYFQQSFQSHPVENPFLYKHIGIGIALNPGESLEEAEKTAQEYLNNYINKNTQYPEHGHIELRDLPVIQKDEITPDYDFVIDQIHECETLDNLKSWQALAMGNVEAIKAYTEKLKQFK